MLNKQQKDSYINDVLKIETSLRKKGYISLDLYYIGKYLMKNNEEQIKNFNKLNKNVNKKMKALDKIINKLWEQS